VLGDPPRQRRRVPAVRSQAAPRPPPAADAPASAARPAQASPGAVLMEDGCFGNFPFMAIALALVALLVRRAAK
jgi:hypothetical protein